MKPPPPEFSFQFFPPKLNAKGWWVAVPTAFAVSIVIICYGIKTLW
jgi:hypothetical protein